MWNISFHTMYQKTFFFNHYFAFFRHVPPPPPVTTASTTQPHSLQTPPMNNSPQYPANYGTPTSNSHAPIIKSATPKRLTTGTDSQSSLPYSNGLAMYSNQQNGAYQRAPVISSVGASVSHHSQGRQYGDHNNYAYMNGGGQPIGLPTANPMQNHYPVSSFSAFNWNANHMLGSSQSRGPSFVLACYWRSNLILHEVVLKT